MKVLKCLRKILVFYLIYALITGAGFFLIHSNNDLKKEDFSHYNTGQDRVTLIEDRYNSGLSRINLIENSQKTLDIAYYTTHSGDARQIFFGSILEAADRGVHVRILLDGIFHNLIGSSKDIQYALVNHPNIELKFYEPLSVLKPWTWNNRLHDKHIIVDNEFAMIGGRNIGDKYYLKDYNSPVYDRDVLIINTDTDNISKSVISDMKDYFNTLWRHEYSKNAIDNLKDSQAAKGSKKEKYLKQYINSLKVDHPEYFVFDMDWHDLSVPADKISFIHNPITRLNKAPWVLSEIGKLMAEAEESVFIQSPYIIPTNQMLKHLDIEAILSAQTTILTNSYASSPNYFAMAGYKKNRKNIANNIDYLYEYQDNGSLHAKSYIIDNKISLIGTFNFDARSSFLSTESMIVVHSEEFSQILMSEIDELTKKSLQVAKDYSYEENPYIKPLEVSRTKLAIINILFVITYFFDFLL
ncbi:phospholipase D family protein [Herbivorax sp. ANBcel31]|uniref:phospholipase D-like domain-containing protein n=1 Tax=Herbivorax sp. ANBcel31 TaxID=3069754 RepID=UPI0027B1E168|nr:phospholipase D family protein [Herbivorax sp. ANBcel31]MDQ2086586.1 phospholipase D family protein [Herbivorax sp. ANBcel31]